MMKMEKDQELKFVCKLCNKKYRCGKSLGGHMKSHLVAKSAESKDKTVGDGHHSSINEPELAKGQSGYGLRENPRKTWRAFDSTLPLRQDNVCKQCGKGFMSSKALCGHMASHSEKLKSDYSWNDENQKIVFDNHSDAEDIEECELRTRSSMCKELLKKVGSKSPPNGRSSSGSEIDEQEEVAKCLMMLSRDYENKAAVNSVVESSDNNSVIMEAKSSSIDMLIAKNEGFVDLKKKDKLKDIILDNEITQSDDSDSDSDYFLGEGTKAESDVSDDGFRMNDTLSRYKNASVSTKERGQKYEHDAGVGKNLTSHRTEFSGMTSGSDFVGNKSRKRKLDFQMDSAHNADTCNNLQKRSKYECFNCKKTFKSFQALGGHRPCHKRTNAYYQSRYDSDENSLQDDSSDYITDTTKQVESGRKRKPSALSRKKVNSNMPQVCPFCGKVFKNGQALGGHKRTHILNAGVGHEENNAGQSPVIKREQRRPDLVFDLNLPAPEEDSFLVN